MSALSRMSALPRGWSLLAGACLLIIAAGCDADPPRSRSHAGTAITTSSSTGTPSDAGNGLSTPDASPPPGWHLWPYPPSDCAVFVPDDVSTVGPLPWGSCPFMADGCIEATAPWAEEYGWGYGGLLSVAVVGTDTYLAVSRAANKELWWESLLYKNDIAIASWLSDPVSLFSLAGAWLSPDGRATMVTIRAQAEASPYVFIGAPETLIDRPDRTELFEPPNLSLTNGLALISPSLLALKEHYGRFTIRNLISGSTTRPEPAQPYKELGEPVLTGDSVYYETWTGNLSSVWVLKEPAVNTPVLKDDIYSYSSFASDGKDAAWLRCENQIGFNEFEIVELYTSPIGPYPQALQPKKIVTLPTTGTPLLSVGDGWIAVRLGYEDVRLYRISDGFERRLPQGVDRAWNGGQNAGLVMTDGKLWVKSVPLGAAGNDVRFIVRFEIDKLPTP